MAKGRKTGGRIAGTPNKVTVEIRDAARQHGPAALSELARIMTSSPSDAARIAACREILDRAYGKAPLAVTGEGGEVPQRIALSWSEEGPYQFEQFIKDAIASARPLDDAATNKFSDAATRADISRASAHFDKIGRAWRPGGDPAPPQIRPALCGI
ncbi:MAG: hypothetical protein ABL908_22360 [Hyphomicrobium sp.]